jgi:sugar O-acyltransferase (sialic acid O-acetyltransferase NeuD family)
VFRRYHVTGIDDGATRVVGVVGAGGCARGVLPILRSQLAAEITAGATYLCFVESSPAVPVVNGTPCVSVEEFLTLPAERREFNVAIAASRVRQRLADDLLRAGALPLEVRAGSATVLDENVIGAGAILCGYTTITSNVRIGAFFHANLYSYVEHDSVIGDYVTFAPGVHCNGNVHIGDHAYLGTGAILRQGTPDKPLVIGAGAVVGMGAVVTKDVAPGETVVGNPARPRARDA